jgi:hypothetical protein
VGPPVHFDLKFQPKASRGRGAIYNPLRNLVRVAWTIALAGLLWQLFSHCPLNGLVHVLAYFPFRGFAAIAS